METTTINLLLLEDDTFDAELVQLALANATDSFRVHWATSLQGALAAMATQPFDVALIDLSLPDSHGIATFSTIRHAYPEVPIVVLSANPSDDLATESLRLGAQDYLLKDRLFDYAPMKTLERSIRYAISRQKNSETQHLLTQLEASHKLLKSKNRRLARLCKTAERFVENVSHEFRTPLTVIKEYASLMRSEMVGPVNSEQARFLNVVENRSDDLNRMVDDMLDGSRLDAGLLVMSRCDCSVAEIIESIRPTLQSKADARRANLEITIDDDLPSVYCDPEKVGRVIVNLAINSIKFCQDPGRVRLHVGYEEFAKNVRISVTDNGPGIDPENLATIFQRFKQVGSRVKQNTTGFGLGLSIASELVDLTFGTLTVVSQPNLGSTFSFTIPVADTLEVVSRWLKRLSLQQQTEVAVSLLEGSVLCDDTEGSGDDLQSLLSYILRADDLLFRVSPGQWIVVIAADAGGVEKFCNRAEETLEAVNRNRRQGPLPALKIVDHGTWQTPSTASSLIHKIEELLRPTGLATVSKKGGYHHATVLN